MILFDKKKLLLNSNGGDSKFVAVGGNTGLITSKDGFAWEKNNSFDGISLSDASIGYANKRYVVFNKGNSKSSSDLKKWDSFELSSGFSGLAYGNDVFVALGGGRVYYSYDSIIWTEVTLPRTYASITFGNGVFVAVASGYIAYSYNGYDWSEIVAPHTGITRICFGSGLFVGCGQAGNTYNSLVSSDGVNWFAGNPVKTGVILHNGSSFMVLGGYNEGLWVCESTDGVSWITNNFLLPESFSFTVRPDAACYGNGLYIYSGKIGSYAGFVVSNNLTDWQMVKLEDLNSVNGVIYAE